MREKKKAKIHHHMLNIFTFLPPRCCPRVKVMTAKCFAQNVKCENLLSFFGRRLSMIHPSSVVEWTTKELQLLTISRHLRVGCERISLSRGKIFFLLPVLQFIKFIIESKTWAWHARCRRHFTSLPYAWCYLTFAKTEQYYPAASVYCRTSPFISSHVHFCE